MARRGYPDGDPYDNEDDEPMDESNDDPEDDEPTRPFDPQNSGNLAGLSSSWYSMFYGPDRLAGSGEIENHRRLARRRKEWIEGQQTDVLHAADEITSPSAHPQEHRAIVPPPPEVTPAPVTPELPSLPSIPTIPTNGPLVWPATTHEPPADPDLRAIWDNSPAGHAFRSSASSELRWEHLREDMQAYQEHLAQEAASDDDDHDDDEDSEDNEDNEWQQTLPATRSGRRQMGRLQPRTVMAASTGQPVGQQFPYQPRPRLRRAQSYGRQEPQVPLSHQAINLPETDVLAVGGSVGEGLWRRRAEEYEMARAIYVADPDLGPDDPLPICLMMQRPLRYHAQGEAWRQSRGVTPNAIKDFPPQVLAVLSPIPHYETLSYALNAFMVRPTLRQVGEHLFQPSSMRGTGYTFFIESDPFLRLLTALYWVRLYMSNDLLAVALDKYPGYVQAGRDLPVGSPQYRHWEPNAPQGTFFARAGTMDRPEWQFGTWKARYYRELWRRTCILLCPGRLLRAQTASYLGTRHVPDLGPALLRAVHDHWRFRTGNPQFSIDDAWDDYKVWLAQRNIVPQAVIDSRLSWQHDDGWQIDEYKDYRNLIEHLLLGEPHLQSLRRIAAQTLRCNPSETILWLMEPMRYCPSTQDQQQEQSGKKNR